MPLTKLNDRQRLVLVSLGVACVIIIGSVLAAAFTPSHVTRIPWKWIRFLSETAFVVWFTAARYRKIWNNWKFRGLAASFLLIHCVGLGYFYLEGDGLNLLGVALVFGVEWIFLAVVIYWLLGETPDFNRKSDGSIWTPSV